MTQQRPEMHWLYRGKLSAVTGPEDRPSLEAAWIRLDKKGNWIIYATNSYVMVWLPVDIAYDTELRERAKARDAIFFPVKALLELEKRGQKIAFFEKDGSVTIDDVTFHIPPYAVSIRDEDDQKGGGWPMQPKAIPAPAKITKAVKNRFEVGFNVDYLKAAAGALESPDVKVIFDLDDPQHQVWVHGMRGNGGEAIIMPIKLNL